MKLEHFKEYFISLSNNFIAFCWKTNKIINRIVVNLNKIAIQ